MAFVIKAYDEMYEENWDKFILEKSMNGTFLQTRKFINYHPKDRFSDASVMVFKGNDLVAVILGCIVNEDGKKVYFSHKGTTFGGLIVSKQVYSVSAINEIIDLCEEYIKSLGVEKIFFKQTASIFYKENADLVDYFLYQKGYKEFSELNFFMNLDKYKEDVVSQFTSSKRRDYRYSLKNNFEFRELEKDEIGKFHEILTMNHDRLNLPTIHTIEDLLDLKYNRFPDKIDFYGVFLEGEMIAGSMIFKFGNGVYHTQYLCSNDAYLKLFPMDYLIGNLIIKAVSEQMRVFTFGICTEDRGRYINLGLSRFKEGFGAEYCINKSFEKVIG